MSINKTLYRPQVIGVDGSAKLGGTDIAGFLAQTDGTITVTDEAGTTLIPAVPVTAGTFTHMPFQDPRFRGATVTLGGGASGILAV